MDENFENRILLYIADDLAPEIDEGLLRTSSLVESGIIDSSGLLSLVNFLESEFGIELEMNKEDRCALDRIDSIAELVRRKTKRAQ